MKSVFGKAAPAVPSLLLPLAFGLALVAAATVAGAIIAPHWGNSAVDLLYLPAVLGVALVGGLRPALISAVASAIAYNFFFTAPRHTFRIDNPVDVVTVAVLLLVAVVVSQLAASVRKQAKVAAAHADRNAITARFAGLLLSSTCKYEITGIAAVQLGTLFNCKTAVITAASPAKVIASSPRGTRLSGKDLARASRTAESGHFDHFPRATIGKAEWQFYALRSEASEKIVVGFFRDHFAVPANPEQALLLQSLLDQLALALERARLEVEAREVATLRESDRIRSTLLATIGRDLKPRVANVSAAFNELRRTVPSQRALVSSMGSEVLQLDRYISNLTDLGLETEEQPLESSGVTIDLFRRAVRRDGKAIHLTPKEFAVLAELARQPGRVLTHRQLLRSAWGPAQESRTEYLRVAIRGLRQKLEKFPAHPQLILNEPAVGYRLVVS